MNLGQSSTSFGAPGTVINTTRLNGDLTLEERAQWIADSYGEDARTIVCGLVRELNMQIDHAFELAKLGDPAFRKSCEKHLATLRAQAKRNREEAARRQEREDWHRQGVQFDDAVRNSMLAIEHHQARRTMILMHVRAGGLPPGVDRDAEVARATAELDAELATLQTQLDKAIADRDAWNAANAERSDAETKTTKGRH